MGRRWHQRSKKDQYPFRQDTYLVLIQTFLYHYEVESRNTSGGGGSKHWHKPEVHRGSLFPLQSRWSNWTTWQGKNDAWIHLRTELVRQLTHRPPVVGDGVSQAPWLSNRLVLMWFWNRSNGRFKTFHPVRCVATSPTNAWVRRSKVVRSWSGSTSEIQLFQGNYADSPYEVVGEFVSSFKQYDDGPQLTSAIAQAKKNAVLVVAEIAEPRSPSSHRWWKRRDWSSKSPRCLMQTRFNSTSMRRQAERQFISQRTTSALKSAKGVVFALGAPSYWRLRKEKWRVAGVIVP